jgi:glycosyltransferase involved in cell wall biosynthesis|tara:strand:+ start:2529 stop:3218 length:690 start_codon:yes stop_codon:yes gene_type:complete
MKISLVIPCYNEKQNLPRLIERCETLVSKHSIEVILVDNGSTDSSSEVIEEYPFIKLVRIEENQGYGYGIIQGLTQATGDILSWTHADLQTDPNDLIRGLVYFKTSKNPEKLFVKGNRKGRPILDNIFTVGMSLFETLLLQRLMWDINAQPTIFHKSFFHTWSNPPKNFSLDLFAYFMAKNSKIEVQRFPVRFSKRLYGVSNWNMNLTGKYKFIKRTLSYSFSLKRKLG